MLPRLFLLLGISLSVLNACKEHPIKYGESFATLMKNNEGLFRGLHLGESLEQVREKEEGTRIIRDDSAGISYELSIPGAGTCIINYGFENLKLYEINVDADFENIQEGSKMLKGFRDYFNRNYGTCQSEKGSLVWIIKKNGPDFGASIELSDESEFDDFGAWHLSIYKSLPAEYVSDSLLTL